MIVCVFYFMIFRCICATWSGDWMCLWIVNSLLAKRTPANGRDLDALDVHLLIQTQTESTKICNGIELDRIKTDFAPNHSDSDLSLVNFTISISVFNGFQISKNEIPSFSVLILVIHRVLRFWSLKVWSLSFDWFFWAFWGFRVHESSAWKTGSGALEKFTEHWVRKLSTVDEFFILVLLESIRQ